MRKKKLSLMETNPALAKEWHPTKNGGLTPSDVTEASNKLVWWLVQYDDPNTGKHFNFEWEAVVYSRKTNGCPFLSGKAVWPGFNDLATVNPDLAREWHPTKNGDLTPFDVTASSNKKIWWLYPYDDPVSGNHFDFEWPASIKNRRKTRCPFLSGKAIWPGFNDLATVNPELAKEWHPTKNGSLTPRDVTVSSRKEVWWLYPYDDPVSGKHFNFEWKTKVSERIKYGCPFISGQAVWPEFNDLATVNPELAKEWHPTKNGDLTPFDVTANSNKKIWWLYPYNDPVSGNHFDFEWQATVADRRKGGCPFLSGRAVWPGFNDLATVNPELAKEWHPTKNGDLTPQDVTLNSSKRVWWLYPYDDPISGNHFNFEWQATIKSCKSHSCPFLSGQAVWQGFNDLATVNPELAKEWHPTKNGDLTPFDVTASSNKKIWWLYPYDDPVSGKHFDFEWPAKVNDRKKNGCPFISGQAVWPGFNDLATVNPELAKEWHPTKNGDLTPFDVTANSNKKIWWLYPYNDPVSGNHFDFEWQATVADRRKGGCPFLSGRAVWPGFNDLKTVYPNLAKEWHPVKNRDLTPFDVTICCTRKVWWLCPECGKEWFASILGRSLDNYSCPRCKHKA